jgi:hypothetical protein
VSSFIGPSWSGEYQFALIVQVLRAAERVDEIDRGSATGRVEGLDRDGGEPRGAESAVEGPGGLPNDLPVTGPLAL